MHTEKIYKELLEEYSKPIPRGLGILAEDLGFNNPVSLLHHINKLVKSGMLKKLRKGHYRTLLKENDSQGNVLRIGYYGEGRCGVGGNFLEDYPEYELTVSTHILERQTQSENLFALKAIGDSMKPQIDEGDLVIAEKLSDISNISKEVSYVVVNSGETLIKKVLKVNSEQVFLVSNNPDHQPFIADEDLRIVGKVVGLYRSV